MTRRIWSYHLRKGPGFPLKGVCRAIVETEAIGKIINTNLLVIFSDILSWLFAFVLIFFFFKCLKILPWLLRFLNPLSLKFVSKRRLVPSGFIFFVALLTMEVLRIRAPHQAVQSGGPVATSHPHPGDPWPPISLACLLSPSTPTRCGSPTAWSEQLPARAQETRALHQGAAEGARKGVRSQQVHHQREAPAHLSHHEPLGAPGHHLVPEPAGEGEEGGQQI